MNISSATGTRTVANHTVKQAPKPPPPVMAGTERAATAQFSAAARQAAAASMKDADHDGDAK